MLLVVYLKLFTFIYMKYLRSSFVDIGFHDQIITRHYITFVSAINNVYMYLSLYSDCVTC